ncbi:hypothetical protein EVB32_141 [Rhizobium phage RHph_TM39]|uniref:Uncharacterized protein n=1 Tax=Rhizobium phage RHph_TM30 TaxID=2509764 RepID=A0A7S5R504_9CAUD|nr:hypothetical protein PQC16_gp141 [Rhizobium phage RHph_TM30]QIG71612.1 hypothetical protein EVB94_141 [Rhizobium phage RHph_TM40]QIG71975.1 hypothetical protein EVB95_141 [Rhizobium phage RHph_TM2_3B]QIG72337.1 hypothetical protein EVB96_141 [Rhizobium phage RHph_TM3_3_6]QIG77129.1 hypothetical protein EVB32_141 [Rhizobium phage RHph_TM39]QIG71248.1 hypothetical protein EVB93_141 [Rhizobium phage RHph_TM30]
MGMFNEVIIKCPKCEGTFIEQTKSGSCLLKTFRLECAPAEELSGLLTDDGSVWCQNCGAKLGLQIQVRVVEKDSEDGWRSI